MWLRLISPAALSIVNDDTFGGRRRPMGRAYPWVDDERQARNVEIARPAARSSRRRRRPFRSSPWRCIGDHGLLVRGTRIRPCGPTSATAHLPSVETSPSTCPLKSSIHSVSSRREAPRPGQGSARGLIRLGSFRRGSPARAGLGSPKFESLEPPGSARHSAVREVFTEVRNLAGHGWSRPPSTDRLTSFFGPRTAKPTRSGASADAARKTSRLAAS